MTLGRTDIRSIVAIQRRGVLLLCALIAAFVLTIILSKELAIAIG